MPRARGPAVRARAGRRDTRRRAMRGAPTTTSTSASASARCDGWTKGRRSARWRRASPRRATRRDAVDDADDATSTSSSAGALALTKEDVLAARKRATLAAVTSEKEIALLLDAAPERVRRALAEDARRLELTEVVLDLGRLPKARFPDGDATIGDELVTYEDLNRMMTKVGDVGRDNRAGINGTLHRISAIKNRYGKVIGATCRVGRAISGSAELIRDVLDAETSATTFNNSILLLGRPGVGKTTAIREISRILSDEHSRRVVIVDTSNEIGGDGDVPHRGIGGARRMQVPNASEQHLVLIEAVENHTPQTEVVDEIGTQQEADTARTISQRGVQMIGTAHGHTLENVLKNPALCDWIGGVVSVTLGDDEARRRGVQKSVLERAGPPTFTIAVEMLDIGTWRVHTDVAASVDALLAGQSPMTELRVLNEDGTVTTEAEYTSRRKASVLGEILAYDATAPRPTAQKVQPRSSSELAALEIASASRRRSSSTTQQFVDNTRFELGGEDVIVNDVEDDEDDNTCPPHALRVFPFKVSRDALERVMESMDLGDRVCLVDLLEDASVVIAPKSQVKTSTWLRHAARARGMPIYAVRADNSAQLVRALQAMLGITGASDGFNGGSGAQENRQRATTSSADETDALEEVRMAVEQLVIPHREPVELLPRSGRIIEMQQALVDTYMLSHSAVGEGTERRLRIEYEYKK